MAARRPLTPAAPNGLVRARDADPSAKSEATRCEARRAAAPSLVSDAARSSSAGPRLSYFLGRTFTVAVIETGWSEQNSR